MVVDERVRPLASRTRPGHGWHRARFGLRAPHLPLPPVLAPAGSSPARGIWLGLKGSDKIKARGALNPDKGWHPNTQGLAEVAVVGDRHRLWVSLGPQSQRWGEEVFQCQGKGGRGIWGSAVPGQPGWSFPGGQHHRGAQPVGPGSRVGWRWQRSPVPRPCSEAGGSPVPGRTGERLGPTSGMVQPAAPPGPRQDLPALVDSAKVGLSPCVWGPG